MCICVWGSICERPESEVGVGPGAGDGVDVARWTGYCGFGISLIKIPKPSKGEQSDTGCRRGRQKPDLEKINILANLPSAAVCSFE